MILDARESRDHQLSRAPKIIQILRLVFAGDDFEKICIQINGRNSSDFDRYPGKKSTWKTNIKKKQNYIKICGKSCARPPPLTGSKKAEV